MFWRVNLVRLELGKAEKPRMSVYFYIHVLTRRLRLMATEKPKKPRMSVWCFTCCDHANFVWWRLGKAEKPRMSVYFCMFWCVEFVWWPLGKAEKNQDGSLVFTCCDTSTSSDGDWAKLKKPRMAVNIVWWPHWAQPTKKTRMSVFF